MMLLAKTGVTKAGYLLKRQSPSPGSNRWRSYFIILNDHCLSYCSEKNGFERPDGCLLLTSGTRVYQQDSENAVIRIETGYEVLILKGKDEVETKEWTKAIHSNVGRLADLARGQFKAKIKGRSKDLFLMLHRECITCHPSFSDTVKITKIYQLTESSSFEAKGDSIEVKGDETLTMTAKNNIEHQHWCYALDLAINRLRKGFLQTIAPPPILPVHSGTLLCMDTSIMMWKKKYVVLTETSIYIHGNRRGRDTTPQQFGLTPNSMIFSTTLRDHSFELVLFSDSIHLGASSVAQREEWIFILQKLIPRSSYNESDALQLASLERKAEAYDTQFCSESSPGILLERRGNWAIAALVSETLSRKVCQGSVLSKIEGESALLAGFDAVATSLGFWRAPLQLTFNLSPRKMGWLSLMIKEKARSWLSVFGPKSKVSEEAVWEKVYATLSSGVLTLFTVKRDGRSKKRSFCLYGSAVGITKVYGSKHCFRVLDGIESIVLQAESSSSMMDWATSIAHSISMENGGGLLMDIEKRALSKDGFWLNGNEFPQSMPKSTPSPIFPECTDMDTAKSIVFTKPIKELRLEPEVAQVTHLEPIAEKKPNHLNITVVTDTTDANTTFHSLDPADISQSMEDFASNFFVTRTKEFPVPVQALRSDALKPWLMLDRVSSTSSSASEIFDQVSDFNESSSHLDGEDFCKLLQLTREITSSEAIVG